MYAQYQYVNIQPLAIPPKAQLTQMFAIIISTTVSKAKSETDNAFKYGHKLGKRSVKLAFFLILFLQLLGGSMLN